MQEISATPKRSPHLRREIGYIQEDVQICLSINKNPQICLASDSPPTRHSDLFLLH